LKIWLFNTSLILLHHALNVDVFASLKRLCYHILRLLIDEGRRFYIQTFIILMLPHLILITIYTTVIFLSINNIIRKGWYIETWTLSVFIRVKIEGILRTVSLIYPFYKLWLTFGRPNKFEYYVSTIRSETFYLNLNYISNIEICLELNNWRVISHDSRHAYI
jgi:hypothetical protein